MIVRPENGTKEDTLFEDEEISESEYDDIPF